MVFAKWKATDTNYVIKKAEEIIEKKSVFTFKETAASSHLHRCKSVKPKEKLHLRSATV